MRKQVSLDILKKEILVDIWDTWLAHEQAGTSICIKHLTGTLPALVCLKMHGDVPLQAEVISGTKSKITPLRLKATRQLMGLISPCANDPILISTILGRLTDKNNDIKKIALDGLAHCRAKELCRLNCMDLLVSLLEDPDEKICQMAAKLVARMLHYTGTSGGYTQRQEAVIHRFALVRYNLQKEQKETKTKGSSGIIRYSVKALLPDKSEAQKLLNELHHRDPIHRKQAAEQLGETMHHGLRLFEHNGSLIVTQGRPRYAGKQTTRSGSER